jgi:hypothetical protein
MAAPMVQVNVRVDPALYVKVKQHAKRERLTMTEAVNAALHNYVTGSDK